LIDEGGEIEHQAAIESGVELEVEVVERLAGIAEAGLFTAASSTRSERRVSSSLTRVASRSMGAIGSACA